MYYRVMLSLLLTLVISCNLSPLARTPENQTMGDSIQVSALIAAASDTTITDAVTVVDTTGIYTRNTVPDDLISFSRTLKGIPYKYGSTNPRVGFDCSGFITYVFNHFNIDVPRTSVAFTEEGRPVDLASSKPGDLILFTGTDSTIRTVGHMGIITQSGDSIVFIHSTSGKANGVTETTLNPYYMGRFVKVIRVFNK
jgi:cell wall-associated NlpC family hydrolase